MGRRIDLQERQIVPVGDSCDHRQEPLSGMRCDYDLSAAPDNVCVCEHKALRRDKEAASVGTVRVYTNHSGLDTGGCFAGR